MYLVASWDLILAMHILVYTQKILWIVGEETSTVRATILRCRHKKFHLVRIILVHCRTREIFRAGETMHLVSLMQSKKYTLLFHVVEINVVESQQKVFIAGEWDQRVLLHLQKRYKRLLWEVVMLVY